MLQKSFAVLMFIKITQFLMKLKKLRGFKINNDNMFYDINNRIL